MNKTRMASYTFSGGNGPPCPSLWKHFSWMGELWLNGNGGEGVWVAWEANVSQGIHEQHNNMQGRSVLRVTPHPPFIAFPRGFRVLSLGQGFSPFHPKFSSFYGFSPFLRDLAPRELFWAPFWSFYPFSSSLGSLGGVGVKWKVLWSEMSVVRWYPWVV